MRRRWNWEWTKPDSGRLALLVGLAVLGVAVSAGGSTATSAPDGGAGESPRRGEAERGDRRQRAGDPGSRVAGAGNTTSTLPAGLRPGQLELDDLAPGFLGIYRKVMEIEEEIRRHTDRYGLDFDLARAVCMYESGGNPELTSWAGARGYFQVMPSTRRLLRVDSNIEAGVKYLAQLVDRFEREDYALAAYNGGPGNVGRSRPMRLESLQYVIGVGHYRTLLKLYDGQIRRHASTLRLDRAREGEDWWDVSRRLDMPLVQLRLHNPYIGHRELQPGWPIAHPDEPREGLFRVRGDAIEYRSRIGDNYFNVAFAFEVSLDDLRATNSLWHLQTLPEGMLLRVPVAWEPEVDQEDEVRVHRVTADQNLAQLAEIYDSTPWRIIRDNGLWNERLYTGTILRIRPVERGPTYVEHRVRRGETLIAIATRYDTSVRAIQDANGMGRRTMIRAGEQLRVPVRGR